MIPELYTALCLVAVGVSLPHSSTGRYDHRGSDGMRRWSGDGFLAENKLDSPPSSMFSVFNQDGTTPKDFFKSLFDKAQTSSSNPNPESILESMFSPKPKVQQAQSVPAPNVFDTLFGQKKVLEKPVEIPIEKTFLGSIFDPQPTAVPEEKDPDSNFFETVFGGKKPEPVPIQKPKDPSFFGSLFGEKTPAPKPVPVSDPDPSFFDSFFGQKTSEPVQVPVKKTEPSFFDSVFRQKVPEPKPAPVKKPDPNFFDTVFGQKKPDPIPVPEVKEKGIFEKIFEVKPKEVTPVEKPPNFFDSIFNRNQPKRKDIIHTLFGDNLPFDEQPVKKDGFSGFGEQLSNAAQGLFSGYLTATNLKEAAESAENIRRDIDTLAKVENLEFKAINKAKRILQKNPEIIKNLGILVDDFPENFDHPAIKSIAYYFKVANDYKPEVAQKIRSVFERLQKEKGLFSEENFAKLKQAFNAAQGKAKL